MTGLIALMLLGCVVRYGPDPEAAAAVSADGDAVVEPRRAKERPDYAGLEAELLSILEKDEDVDADRQARVHAAQELTLAMRSPRMDPDAAVEAYLRALIEIESRSLVTEQAPLVGEGVVSVPIIEEESLVEEETLGEDTEPTDPIEEAPVEGAAGPSPEEAVTSARAALSGEDYSAAIQALEPHLGKDAPAELESLYLEAVDGWVHQERERAGALFLEARSKPAGEQEAAMKEVEELLMGLLVDYPDSSYTDAIERNLVLVRKELRKK